MRSYQDTENKVLGDLLRCPLEGRSLRQIAINTGLSYVTVHKLIPILLRKRAIKLEKKGRANIISVDFEQAEIERLSSAMLDVKKAFLKKNLSLTFLVKEIEEVLAGKFYCLILFGSYAKGKAREDSDIDFLFIVPGRVEAYEEKISKAMRLYPNTRKDFKIISMENFIDMLNQRYTIGRSVFQQGIVLFGTEHYYSAVRAYVREKGY